jgi:hypothetical protein
MEHYVARRFVTNNNGSDVLRRTAQGSTSAFDVDVRMAFWGKVESRASAEILGAESAFEFFAILPGPGGPAAIAGANETHNTTAQRRSITLVAGRLQPSAVDHVVTWRSDYGGGAVPVEPSNPTGKMVMDDTLREHSRQSSYYGFLDNARLVRRFLQTLDETESHLTREPDRSAVFSRLALLSIQGLVEVKFS